MAATENKIDVRQFIDARPFSGYQWVLLVLCFLSMFVDGFDTGAMGYVAPSLRKAWVIAPTTMGWLMSISLVGLAIGALVGGPVADRVGRKRVLTVAVFLFGLFTLGCAFAVNPGQLIVLRFLTGLGLGAAMPNAITLTTEYTPEKRRSLLVTLMFCGLTLGSALGGLVAAAVIPRIGWQGVFLLGGAVPLLLSLALAFLLPESARFLVVRGAGDDKVRKVLSRIAPGEIPETAGFTTPEVVLGQKKNSVAAILSPDLIVGTLLLWTIYFMGLVVIFLVTSWMPTLMEGVGYDLQTRSLVTSLFQFGGTFGALLVGYCMDRFGPHIAITCSYALGAVCIFLLGQTGSNLAVMSLCVVGSGFFMSGSQTPMAALCGAFYPTQMRATGVAWMAGIGRWGGILGSFIGAPLLALGWSFQTIYTYLAIPAVIASLAVATKGAYYARKHSRVEELAH